MEYKSDKHKEDDDLITEYTHRRIQEMRGEKVEALNERTHSYIRRRLDEIKKFPNQD